MRARDLGSRAPRVRRTAGARSTGGATRLAPEAVAAESSLPAPAVPFPRLSVAGLVYLRGRDADARLRALEAQRVGVRPVLGALAARLRAIRGWRALGFRNLADFARERLGVEGRSVSEWARVWSALEELPALRGAVLAGEVSWTVARRVVRVATPETDAACLATVRGRTVRAVDALVAAWREGKAQEEGPGALASASDAGLEEETCADARVPVRIEGPPRLAAKWDAAVELGRRSAGEMLPVWGAADWIAAEVSSALPAVGVGGPAADAGREPVHRPRPGDPEPGARHAAFPRVPWRPLRRTERDREEARAVDALVEGLEDCGPHELDARLRAAARFLQGLDQELGRILRQVLGRKLYRELGFESFERYVAERLDASPRTARRLVRLARAEHTAPRVAAGFREGRLSAFQADTVLGTLARDKDLPAEVLEGVIAAAGATPAPTADASVRAGCSAASSPAPDAESRWLALAERVTLRRLEREAEAQPPGTPPAVAFHAPPEVAAFFRAVLEQVRRRMGPGTPPWAALEAMLDHAIATWLEQGQQFRDYADFERDDFWCTAPGCTARSQLESHHIVYRSAGGPDEPGNRTSLCWFHHHAGIHGRWMRVAGRAPDRLFFELGMRPDGPPLARYRSGDVIV